MEDRRNLVKKYFNEGKLPAQIFKMLRKTGVSESFVKYTIKRLRETGSIKNRPKSGRPRSARTKKLIKAVRERIRRNPERSARKLAADFQVSNTTMRRVLKNDLQLKPYKKRKLHGLTTKQREKRVKRSRALLKRHGKKSIENIIFSDEKLFVIEQHLNAQNDRIYLASFEDIPEELRTVQRFQKSSSVMVWGAVSQKGKLPLVFIEKGVKINADYYQKENLEGSLKTWAPLIHENDNWCFQQDSAPSHMAKATQGWCERECPGFIKTEEWPPSSPDLNPLDYCVWGTLEGKVNAKQHRSLDSLKRKLSLEWDKLSMKTVRAAIGAWRKRLGRVVNCNGGRFE